MFSPKLFRAEPGLRKAAEKMLQVAFDPEVDAETADQAAVTLVEIIAPHMVSAWLLALKDVVNARGIDAIGPYATTEVFVHSQKEVHDRANQMLDEYMEACDSPSPHTMLDQWAHVADQYTSVIDFLDWIESEYGIRLDYDYVDKDKPAPLSHRELADQFFDVDRKKLEE